MMLEGGENSDAGNADNNNNNNNNNNSINNKCELENQFVLRLPQKQADQVRRLLRTKPKKLRKAMFIDLDPEARTGTVVVNRKTLDAQLVALPAIVESSKTVDGVNLFKTADVSQMLVCHEPGEEPRGSDASFDHPHGLTPPLKNARKFRFRKTVKNKGDLQEAAEIEKEIVYLLRMDFEAVSTKYEIQCEEPPPKATAKREDIDEHSIFGGLISDSNSEQESGSDANDIMEYTN